MRSMIRGLSGIFAVVILSTLAGAVTMDDIIRKLEENIAKIKDMEADVEVRADIGKGTQFTQSMKVLSKGAAKVRMVSLSPEKQTIILNGTKMQIEDSKGEKKVIDRNSISIQGRAQTVDVKDMNAQRSIARFLKDGNARITGANGSIYTLEVIPGKQDRNPLMQKAELSVDHKRGVITSQKLYSNMGVTVTDISYTKIGNTWVMSRTVVTTPVGFSGETATMTMDYNNIEINKGIPDKVFAVDVAKKN
jgi:outer membrane lipoprotein-sorting protein